MIAIVQHRLCCWERWFELGSNAHLSDDKPVAKMGYPAKAYDKALADAGEETAK